MSDIDPEVVIYVGIAVHDRAFTGLPSSDREFIACAMHIPGVGIRPILRHGEIVGYGIPILIADTQHEFESVGIDEIYIRMEQARAKFTNVVRLVAQPFVAKCYAPKLFHDADPASA